MEKKKVLKKPTDYHYKYNVTILRWKPEYYKALESHTKKQGLKSVNNLVKLAVAQFIQSNP